MELNDYDDDYYIDKYGVMNETCAIYMIVLSFLFFFSSPEPKRSNV